MGEASSSLKAYFTARSNVIACPCFHASSKADSFSRERTLAVYLWIAVQPHRNPL